MVVGVAPPARQFVDRLRYGWGRPLLPWCVLGVGDAVWYEGPHRADAACAGAPQREEGANRARALSAVEWRVSPARASGALQMAHARMRCRTT